MQRFTRKGLGFALNPAFIFGLAIAGLVYWGISRWLGPGVGILTSLVGTFSALSLLKWLNTKFFRNAIPFVSDVPIIKGFNSKAALTWGIVLGIVFVAMTGTGWITSMFGNNPFTSSASLASLVTTLPADQAAASATCSASISDELRGKQTTVTINAYDLASATPYSSAVDVNPVAILVNGEVYETTTDTSDYDFTIPAGSVISFRGGSSSYYLGTEFDATGTQSASNVESFQ